MSILRSTNATLTSLLLICLLGSELGCHSAKNRWTGPLYVRPVVHPHPGNGGPIDLAERLYAQATELEQQCQAACVDLYFEVARLTSDCDAHDCRQFRRSLLHKSALAKIVDAGQRFQRLVPHRGLKIGRAGQQRWVPIRFQGFVWKPTDFQQLVPVGDYATKSLRCFYRRPGVGIPLVVASGRCPDGSFIPKESFFPATLVMTRTGCHEGCDAGEVAIQLIDPLRVDKIKIAGRDVRIAKDTSAPYVYRFQKDPPSMLDGFLDPYRTDQDSRLYTVEPFQRGKIPVVFVHGMLSDPYTWAEMINALRTCPWFVRNYQAWVFEYPTGQVFVRSATEFREQLALARQTFDPQRTDLALSKMVLVGHSMGGLLAKLQITCSGDRLWRSVANRPFSQVHLSPEYRRLLSTYFFFRPSPDVDRVVFIGTPHRGSGYAQRLIGKIGSALVRIPEQQRLRHDQAVAANPGVFSQEVARRVPTSVMMLDPNSQLLQAIDHLPINPAVQMHSIIGNKKWKPWTGSSDGIVPVHSARQQGSLTERMINERHVDLNDCPEGVEEVMQILRLHLTTSGSPDPPDIRCTQRSLPLR